MALPWQSVWLQVTSRVPLFHLEHNDVTLYYTVPRPRPRCGLSQWHAGRPPHVHSFPSHLSHLQFHQTAVSFPGPPDISVINLLPSIPLFHKGVSRAQGGLLGDLLSPCLSNNPTCPFQHPSCIKESISGCLFGSTPLRLAVHLVRGPSRKACDQWNGFQIVFYIFFCDYLDFCRCIISFFFSSVSNPSQTLA